jgi:CMP/dCMP kinase
VVITIDGPAISGKSAVAKRLAAELKIYYLYTGILYRGVAFSLLEKYGQEVFVAPEKIKDLSLDFIQNFVYKYVVGKPKLLIEGNDVTAKLFETKIDQLASIVSTSPQVRNKLLPVQQDVAKSHSLVADGRDCGSVVFPDAEFKFFLTANLKTRAQRWLKDKRHDAAAKTISIKAVVAEIKQRDKRDLERKIAPLRVPNGAMVIDNSNLTIDETVVKFLAVIRS